jgi:DNA-binding response OmpR family regulator
MNTPALNLVTPSARSAFSVPVHTPLILLVDDDRIMRTVIAQSLSQQGFQVLEASRGEEALATMVQNEPRIDAIVLDREMPGMNGMDVVEHMKTEHRLAHIPVIMLTGTGDQDKIQEGINAGVFYYLVKPVEEKLLRSVIDSALRERQQKCALVSELNRHGQALKAMQSCRLAIRTLSQAEDTACFLASCFPDAERVVSGLLELLVNAIEHGNLGVNYAEKAKLLNEGRWHEELEQRVHLPQYKDKMAEVYFERTADTYTVQVKDCGQGFNWKPFLQIDLARATASHGRGIARARLMAFDTLEYNEAGNCVTVAVYIKTAGKTDYAW